MPRLARKVTALFLLALACVESPVGWSQEQTVESTSVLARTFVEKPTRGIVEFVARNAEPTVYGDARRPEIEKQTIRQVIESLCGSVQPGYMEELIKQNALPALTPESSLGPRAPSVRWPACVYARPHSDTGVTYTVKKNDTLTGIIKRFTGDGTFDPKRLDSFFKSSDVKTDNAQQLKAGTKLTIPFITAATVLRPKAMTQESFVSELRAVGGSQVAGLDRPVSPGKIIGPVRFSSGGIQSGFAPCNRGDGTRSYPFNPQEAYDAYRATLLESGVSQSRVFLVILDNGFFGAHCPDAAHCPEVQNGRALNSDRFPNDLFDFNRFKLQLGYGPMLSGTEISPLNFWNRKSPPDVDFTPADINEETGHGTHVAGIAIGGPAFVPLRDAFSDSAGRRWLTLVIANLSGGSPQLSVGSDRNLAFMLDPIDGFKIVNMSVAFDAAVDASVAPNIKSALKDDKESLFIVAAGNSGGDLDGDALALYPAKLGGMASANVMTIASIDGPDAGRQRLSNFSNWNSSYVDLAAGGCHISSWIDADSSPIESSGTSQATPLVSFTMALLKSLWSASPLQLKNRALYSGDLLETKEDRAAIRSMSQLDVPKTLTFLWDRVTYTRAGRTATVFGSLSQIQGVTCMNGAAIDPANIKSIKRDEDRKPVVFSLDPLQNLRVCGARFDPDNTVSLEADREMVGGQLRNIPKIRIDLTLKEIDELVKAQ